MVATGYQRHSHGIQRCRPATRMARASQSRRFMRFGRWAIGRPWRGFCPARFGVAFRTRVDSARVALVGRLLLFGLPSHGVCNAGACLETWSPEPCP